MADGKIYITISDERIQNKTGGTGGGSSKSEESEKEKENKWLDHEMMHFIKAQAQQMANYALNNIGNFTGDYQTQREIQASLSMIGVISNIGISAIAGFKYAGVGGAIVGAGISIASQGINFALSEATAQVQIKKQNYEIERMRDISGLNGLTNGSRI